MESPKIDINLSDYFLIVGLGNPGIKYVKTRHNVGFMFLDHLAYDLGFLFREESKFSAEIASKNGVNFMKPLTFMNNSGDAVSKFLSFYKHTDLNTVLVVHDDVDLNVGDARLKQGGGSAGHHGIEDISQKIGNDFWRLRIGIGRPQEAAFEITDWVLCEMGRCDFQDSLKMVKYTS